MGVKSKNNKCGCFFIGVLFGLLSGCNVLAPFDTSLTEWNGHPVSELIDSWGEPDQSSSLGNESVALTWVEPDSLCEHTFIAIDGRITGYSDSDC
jgi:hypothetical protein